MATFMEVIATRNVSGAIALRPRHVADGRLAEDKPPGGHFMKLLVALFALVATIAVAACGTSGSSGSTESLAPITSSEASPATSEAPSVEASPSSS